MSRFATWIDPRAVQERKRLSKQQIKDTAGGTMRWALHLSDREEEILELLNPDTLGNYDDAEIHKKSWAKFIASSDSAPYRINKV